MTTIKPCGCYTTAPAPKEVLGGFIESGFGRQVPMMWSEMLYNRAFRTIPPYKYVTWDWLQLDAAHYNENAPFWHSGYEENDWYYLDNTRHWFSTGHETYKGLVSNIISASEKGGVTGVAQDGIHLEAGREYRLRIFCCASSWTANEAVQVDGYGQIERASDPRSVHISLGDQETVIDASGEAREQAWTFTANTTQICTLSITYDWAGDLVIAYTSLMPTDNLQGWRRDVVEAMKEVAPTVVRFPGGCFTSFFNWRNSVGPRERREPQESFYWGGLEDNDVGLGEFMNLAELVGFEGQICFNMMTSTPFDARCMVEYLNAPADVGYGRLRALDGHPAPYGVKLFECDNEPFRKWTARQYAQECVEFAREMRQVTPDAKFLMAAYAYDLEQLPLMLEIAGGDIDYVIQRDGSPEFVEKNLPIIRAYNEKTGRDIKLCNTEWLASFDSPEPYDEPTIPAKFGSVAPCRNHYDRTISRYELSWNYALNGAHRILDYISYGGEFALANFNNMCNTWGQNAIEASKDTAWLSCMGEVFSLFRRTFAPCTACAADTGDELLFALFTRDDAGAQRLYIVNHGREAKTVGLPAGYKVCVDGLTAAKRSAYASQNCRPVDVITVEVDGNTAELPGLSITVFEKR